MEYGYKEHGGIGADKIKDSVKRRRNSISDGTSSGMLLIQQKNYNVKTNDVEKVNVD